MKHPDLGARVRVHREAHGVLALMVVCALIPTVFFVILSIQSGVWWVEFWALGFGIVLMGCWRWWVRAAFTRVTVFERGIAWRVGLARGSCVFSDIERIEVVPLAAGLRISHASGATILLSGSLSDRAALLESLDGKIRAAELPTATLVGPAR